MQARTDARQATDTSLGVGRRTLLQATGAAMMPGTAWAGLFQCNPPLRIALLAPITGPLAGTSMGYVEGVRQAVESSAARGCAMTLAVLDASGAARQISATVRAVQAERAAVVMAPYGSLIAMLAAESTTDALVIDLLQSPPLQKRSPNLVAVPYTDLFFTSIPEQRTESLRAVGRAAVNILLETLRDTAPGSIRTPGEFIDAMSRRRFQIPGGMVSLDRASGAFRRV